MKKTKVIIPALGILLLSTAASVTGTVAWFSSSDRVTANNMNVKARAEQGIVISNETVDEWKESADASYPTAVALNPTSTADFSTWYHNSSDDANDAKAGQAASTYKTLDIKDPTVQGVGFVDDNDNGAYNDASEKAYFILNKFYIKASAGAAITNTNLHVLNVVITKTINQTGEGAAGSANLNKSLRIGVSFTNGNSMIFAPEGATASYKVGGASTSTTAIIPGSEGAIDLDDTNYPGSGITTIPNNNATKGSGTNPAVEALVYLYFEGEDLNCKSSNLIDALDNLNVSIKFGLVA